MEAPHLRISIFLFGTRGSIQPGIALALALKTRGHFVRVITSEKHIKFVTRFSLEAVSIVSDMEIQKDAVNQGNSSFLVKQFIEHMNTPKIFDEFYKIFQESDVVVSLAITLNIAVPISMKLNVPLIPLLYQPSLETGEFPNFMIANSLPFKFLNHLSYKITGKFFWWFLFSSFNNVLSEKGFPLMTSYTVDEFYQNSPSILSFDSLILPGEKVPSDWPQKANVTGFLFMPDGVLGNLSIETENWLGEDPASKPVYIGFGSMPSSSPAELLKILLKVVYSLRIRAIYTLGWSELTNEMKDEILVQDTERRIFILSESPHDVLFPRCSAIIHHGGMGTTAAALRAGVPQIIFPHVADQPWIANRIFLLGLSPPPLPIAKLTFESLQNSIQSVLQSAGMLENAQKISSKIGNGVEKAVEIVEQEYFNSNQRITQ